MDDRAAPPASPSREPEALDRHTLLERWLRDAPDLVEHLLEELPMGFVSVDRELRVRYLNRTAETAWEMPLEQALGRRMWELFPEAATGAAADALARMAATGEGVQFESFYGEANRWTEVFAFPTSDGFSAFFLDVTGRRLAELERNAAEARYRDIVEEVPAITYLDDASETGRGFVFVSPQSKQILGHSPEEWILNRNLWHRLVHPDDLEAVVNERTRCRGLGIAFEAEYRMLARDGRVVWVHDRSAPLLDQAGRPKLVHGVMLDITAHREAEEAIERRDSILAAVGYTAEHLLRSESWEAAIEDPLARLGESAAVDRVDLIELRPEGEARSVWSRAEWCAPGVASVGEQLRGLLMPPGHAFLTRLASGEPLAGPATGDPAGHPCPYRAGVRSYALAPLFVASRLWGFLALGEMTSERTWSAVEMQAVAAAAAAVAAAIQREEADERLRASVGALTRSNEERQRLLARLVKAQEEERRRVANDIHDDSIQVMTAVGLRLAALRSQVRDPVPERTLTAAEQIVAQAIHRLRRLLFELRPMSLDNSGLVAALNDHVRLMREPGAPEFSLDAELGAEPPVECRTILYRIAQEALTNVRKHARATNVRIEVRSEGTGVTMRIRDDGVGFDPASAPNGAVGHVGIPSMRERAHLAGGWVHFDSSPGRGTTVEVWVPRIMAEDANASPAGPAREARAAADPA